MPMSVLVLYRVDGEDEPDDEYNCFAFKHPSDVRGLRWLLSLVVVF